MPDIVNQYDTCNNLVHTDHSKLFKKNCPDCGSLPSYADDATLVLTGNDRVVNQRKLSKLLAELSSFLNDNELAINQEKTVLMEIMMHQKRCKLKDQPPNLSVLDKNLQMKEISTSKNARLLGINLQDNLSWNAQLNTGEKALFPATRKILGALRHIGNKTDLKTRMALANSLVMSKLHYLLPIWGGATKKYRNELQIIMNTAARYVTKLRKRTKTMILMNRCNWLMADEFIETQTLIQMWKVLHFNKPQHVRDNIEIELDWTLSTNRARLKTVELGWRWRAVRQWNMLPDVLRKCGNLNTFKNNVKKHIISRRINDPG